MERGREVQLIINPGSTSTKLALFQGEEKMIQEDVVHRTEAVSYTHLDVYKRQNISRPFLW